MLEHKLKKIILLENTSYLFILLFCLGGHFTSAQDLQICAGEEITLEGWRGTIDCCGSPPSNLTAPWDCWPETQPGGFWTDGDGNVVCQNCIDLTIVPPKSTTYTHLTPGYECPPSFPNFGDGPPGPAGPDPPSYPASPITQIVVTVQNCDNQIGDGSFANLIECPDDNSTNVCAPVDIASLGLEDFSLSEDAVFLSGLSLQMEEQIEVQKYFTTTTQTYTISDESGNQKTCETQHHIAKQFLQAPEVNQSGVICQEDLWSSIKIGTDQYKIYADQNGAKGAIMSTCNTPGLICSTAGLGVDTKVPDTYNFWASTYFEFPDGSICESEAMPFYVDVQAKPVAELVTSIKTIQVGEGLALMDFVSDNKSGYWSGENIVYLMTASGENIAYFSSNSIGTYKLYYTVKNDVCEQSYFLLVEVKNNDILGCTNEEAYNYNWAATVDDGSCIYPGFNAYDHPWLSSLINSFNCSQQIELNEYHRSDNTYIYIENESGGILYLEDGTIYCSDEDGETCLENNSLLLGNPTYKWACFEDALQRFNRVYTICEGDSISLIAKRDRIEIPCVCEECIPIPFGGPTAPPVVIWQLPPPPPPLPGSESEPGSESVTCNNAHCGRVTVSPTATTHYSAVTEADVYSRYARCDYGPPGPNGQLLGGYGPAPPGAPGAPGSQPGILTYSDFLVIVEQCPLAKPTTNNQTQKTMYTSFSMYPNPTNHKIFIDLQEKGIYQISLTDISGKLMKQLETKIDESIIEMNVNDLPKGMYLVELKNESNQMFEKLIIE